MTRGLQESAAPPLIQSPCEFSDREDDELSPLEKGRVLIPRKRNVASVRLAPADLSASSGTPPTPVAPELPQASSRAEVRDRLEAFASQAAIRFESSCASPGLAMALLNERHQYPVLKRFVLKDGALSIYERWGCCKPSASTVSQDIEAVLAITSGVLKAQEKFTLLASLLGAVCKQRRAPAAFELHATIDCFEKVASASAQMLGADSPAQAAQMKGKLFASIGVRESVLLCQAAALLGVMMSHPTEGLAASGDAMMKGLGLNAENAETVIAQLNSNATRNNRCEEAAKTFLIEAMKLYDVLVQGPTVTLNENYDATAIRLVFQNGYRLPPSVPWYCGPEDDAYDMPFNEPVVRMLCASNGSDTPTQYEQRPIHGEWFYEAYKAYRQGDQRLYLANHTRVQPKS